VLHDLKVVSIILDAEDDAQIIFETLNGRGAQLYATDLIRNYLFMRADEDNADPEALYDTLWSQFETDYWATEQRRGRLKKPRLEWLIHASLQAELHEEVDLSRLYFEYRRYAINGGAPLTAEAQLLKLNEYAKHYKELISGSGTSPIAKFGRRINPYDITTLYPLALMISASNLSDHSKSEMLSDLVSYLVRRAVCGLTFKNYNNVFLTTLRQLHTSGVTPSGLRKILGELSGEASRWPSDGEFRGAFLTAPLYYGRLDPAKMRSILTEIEGYLRSTVHTEEPILPDLTELDIDHILPRSWFEHWPIKQIVDTAQDNEPQFVSLSESSNVEVLVQVGETLDERQRLISERQNALSRLGNLTLLNLSVNRAAQNYAFASKRDLLIANTNLRLNIPLITMASWDEDDIKTRGGIMADAALAIWPGPRE
jgi:hypothetical protein